MTIQTAQNYCQRKTEQSGSNFYWGLLGLSKAQQAAFYALYAYCREVDDIVDDIPDKQQAETLLDQWAKELKRLPKKQATTPIGIALQTAQQKFNLENTLLETILTGMRMDLNHQGFATQVELEHYCYHVASAVGLLAIEIFGYQNPKTKNYAINLGMALQLVNIIRDVGEDAKRGRVYLPKNLLRAYELTPEDILEQQPSGKLSACLYTLSETTEQFFEQAFHALPKEDAKSQRSGLIMGNIYREILHKLTEQNFPVFQQKIRLTKLHKSWVILKTFLNRY